MSGRWTALLSYRPVFLRVKVRLERMRSALSASPGAVERHFQERSAELQTRERDFHSGSVARIPGLKSETWGTLRFLPTQRWRSETNALLKILDVLLGIEYKPFIEGCSWCSGRLRSLYSFRFLC